MLAKLKLFIFLNISKLPFLYGGISFMFFTEADIENLIEYMQAENPNAKLDDYEVILNANIEQGIPGRFALIFHHDSIFINDIYADEDNYTNGSDTSQLSPAGSDGENFNSSNDE